MVVQLATTNIKYHVPQYLKMENTSLVENRINKDKERSSVYYYLYIKLYLCKSVIKYNKGSFISHPPHHIIPE